MENKWYIVRTQVNKEKSVSEKIKKELEVGDLMNKVSRVIVPTEFINYIKNGKKVKREKILYPGYVFVESSDVMILKDYLKHVNGASGFLTTRSGTIQSLSEREIKNMIHIQEESAKKIEVNPFVINEEVVITDGPFTSMRATINEINEKTKTVKVGVSIFGRKTPIELSLLQIAKP